MHKKQFRICKNSLLVVLMLTNINIFWLQHTALKANV